MLADIRYWENDATNKHYAIAHFNVWNAEMLMGVIDAAEEAKSPVIISFGTGISAEIIFIVPGTCNIAFEFFILNPPVLFIDYCINT